MPRDRGGGGHGELYLFVAADPRARLRYEAIAKAATAVVRVNIQPDEVREPGVSILIRTKPTTSMPRRATHRWPEKRATYRSTALVASSCA